MNAFSKAPSVCDDSASDEALIIAIAPAPPGWWAVWRDADGEMLEPVPAFAMVESGWQEVDDARLVAPARTHRMRWGQAMVHDGNGGCSLMLAERRDGYCGLRYVAPGADPATAWASDCSA